MIPHDSYAQIEFGAGAQPRPNTDETGDSIFRILILGEFGGASAGRQPLASRGIHRIDRDGIDAAMAAVAPMLVLTIDADAAPETIAFRELDDFHPDHLLTRVRMLARLRALRTTIETRPNSASTQAKPAAASGAPDGRSLLDRMLDADPPPPAPSARRTRSTGDDLSDFVQRAVRSHTVREVDPEQRSLVAQVDEVLAATLRVLLHDPAFQALESLWRATDLFLRRCDAGKSTVIGLLDVTRAEVSALRAHAGETDALSERLASNADGDPWSLVIAAHQLGAADIALLSAMASAGEAMRTPWLCAADPRLAGATTFANNGDADDWDHAPIPGWDELRHLPAARFLGLALPRFLVRLPYGAENPVESMSFDEQLSGPPPHESFLWGNGAFLCALVASAPVDRGAVAPSHGAVAGLPLHLDASSGSIVALPCAEAVLSQRSVLHVLSHGLIPLAGERDGDVVRIPRLQSIAAPPTALSIRPAVRTDD
jgi:type VI secretion system protein ImpC